MSLEKPYSFYRAGYTESTLLFVHYLDTIGQLHCIKDRKSQWKNISWACRWLYNCCGLYDNTVDIHTDHEKNLSTLIKTPVFNDWLKEYKAAIKASTCSMFLLHRAVDVHEHINSFMDEYKSAFIISTAHPASKEPEHLLYKNPHIDSNILEMFKAFYTNHNYWYVEVMELARRELKNNRVLIVSNMGESCKKHYLEKNINNVTDLGYVDYPSCFGNMGPDNNHMETIEHISKQINNVVDNYDVVIFACGASAVPLANKISNNIKKLCIGSGLHGLFGITPEEESPSPGVFKIPKDIRSDLTRYFGEDIMKD